MPTFQSWPRGQSPPLWSAIVGMLAEFLYRYLFQRYLYAKLPRVVRIVLLVGSAFGDTRIMARAGSQLLFVASCAPIVVAYHHLFLDPGGPLILSAILCFCHFICPGSAYRWDAEAVSDDSDQPLISPGTALKWLAYGILIPRTELSWSFIYATLWNPRYRYALYLLLVMVLASVVNQFRTQIRISLQRAYRPIQAKGFGAYQKYLLWRHQRRFSTTAGNNDPFEYESLNEAASEIRLLRLSKLSRSHASLQISIIASPLADAPSYVAISYRWSPGPKVPVLVNGKTFFVSEPLYFMLEGLREREKEAVVWIDAICINQEDMDEKRWQILLMGDLYASAAQVVGWISFHPHSSGALSLLDIVGSCADKPGTSSSPSDRAESLDNHRPAINQILAHLDTPDCPELIAVFSLLSNDWFSRLWVVQEIARGRNVIVRHGDEVLAWEQFYTAVVAFGLLMSQRGVYMGHEALHELSVANAQNIFSIDSIKRKLYSHPGGLPMGFLLRETRYFHASLPHDMVYGLLGLSTKEARKMIKMDYTMSEDMSIYLASLATLLGEQNLDYLLTGGWYNAPTDPSKGSLSQGKTGVQGIGAGVLELPSWVQRRYHQESSLCPLTLPSLHIFHAATHLKTLVTVVPSTNKIITIQGAFIDQITSLSPTFSNLGPEGKPKVDSTTRDGIILLLSNIDIAFQFAEANAPFRVFNKDTERAVWTVITNKLDESQPERLAARDSFHSQAKEALRVVREGSKIWGRSALFIAMEATRQNKIIRPDDGYRFAKAFDTLREAVGVTANRRLCRTKTGYLGVVPMCARTGDDICVFSGADVPCTVRARPGHEDTRRRAYDLLGACYVSGIMHGELAKEELVLEPIILG